MTQRRMSFILALAISFVSTVTGHTGEVRDACFSSGDRFIVSCGDDGTVRIFDGNTYEPVGELPAHPDTVTCLVFTPAGDKLVTTCDDGIVRVFDFAERSLLFEMDEHKGPLLRATVSKDSKLAASGGEDGTVALWDLTTGDLLMRFGEDGPHSKPVWGIAFSPSGMVLACANRLRLVFYVGVFFVPLC